MPPAKPSLELLRSLTDEHVLRALMAHPRLTRAEIATRTGLSKPTASESARRLTEVGLLRDTGERTTGRGRIGSYFALAADLGTALAVDISPTAVAVEAVDVYGHTVTRVERPLPRPTDPAHVADALRTGAQDATPGRVHLAVVSAADPVDRATGRLVHLPDAPFLVGELSPAEVLAPLVDGPVETDNDVNWAARAEQTSASDGTLADFAYLHLGEGLGCAVVSDGEVRRGHHGLSGEIAHLVTTGPDDRAMPFTQVFAELGLRRPGTTAIDDGRLLRILDDRDGVREGLARAITGVVAALVALADPEVVILGGSWGTHPLLRRAIDAHLARLPRSARLRAAAVVEHPALAGARRRAIHRLRDTIIASSHTESSADRRPGPRSALERNTTGFRS
jgi:predicted NBD/HSP70 family sugar kinase